MNGHWSRLKPFKTMKLSLSIRNKKIFNSLSDSDAGQLIKAICSLDTDFAFTSDEAMAAFDKIAPQLVKNEPPTCYAACMEEYHNFILQHLSVPPKINATEGKALKDIIQYLASIANNKDDQGIVNAFKYVLIHKDRWDPFHQNQLKLQQINSNLINIINSIKNGTAKKNLYEQSKYR